MWHGVLTADDSAGSWLIKDFDAPQVEVHQLIAAGWKTDYSYLTDTWLFATKDRRALGAFDPRTFELLWQLPHGDRRGLASTARSGDVGLLSIRTYASNAAKPMLTVLGVDALSGQVLWRKEVEESNDHAGQTLAAGGTFWVTSGNQPARQIEVLEPRTGAVVWSARSDVWHMLASGNNVILMTSTQPMVFEKRSARTGQLGARREVEGHVRHATLLDAGVLYVSSNSGQLSAFSAETLEPLWKRPLHPDPSRDGGYRHRVPRMAASDEAVVLCENSTMRAFARQSGEELWSYGLELHPCGTFAVAPGPRVYVPRTSDIGDSDRRGDNAIIEYAPSSRPPETVTVRGQVPGFEGYFAGAVPSTVSPAGAEVLLNNQIVKVAADGSYQARVTTRGILRVDVHVPLPDDSENEKCNPGAQGHAEIPLVGVEEYTADLELERHCW
jgi:outer membrane protein assembly factor BamB